MNYYIFKKEDNDFSEMLSDITLKPLLDFKIKFKNHLILGSQDNINEQLSSYITLKYGDMMVNKSDMFMDNKPKIHIDYTPDRNRPEKYKKI